MIFKQGFKVTQAFGANPEYYHAKDSRLKGHEGIDIIPKNWNYGIHWPFTSDAVCTRCGYSSVYGNFIYVWDKVQCVCLIFAHMSEATVEAGTKIVKDKLIGIMGDTGNSTAPHLHLCVVPVDDSGMPKDPDNGYLGGVDPYPYIKEFEK